MMSNRKVQIYLTEDQYRLLKQRAGQHGSIAQAVRDLIDRSTRPDDLESDPFYRHLISQKKGSGSRYSAEEAKKRLHRNPH